VLAGLLYAPLLAARILCGRFARPAALAGLVWGATRGVLRMVALRGLNPANLLAQVRCSCCFVPRSFWQQSLMSMITAGVSYMQVDLACLAQPG
jgi:hypothetical protein